MKGPNKTLRAVVLGLGYFFLYVPIISLMVFSFNASPTVTSWTGFSFRWYHALVNDDALLRAAWREPGPPWREPGPPWREPGPPWREPGPTWRARSRRIRRPAGARSARATVPPASAVADGAVATVHRA